jgi:hypothetical protein
MCIFGQHNKHWQQAPIVHCNACITIFDPNFLGIDTTYKNLSLHFKSIYERLLKKRIFQDKIIIFVEKLWYLSRKNMPLLRQ